MGSGNSPRSLILLPTGIFDYGMGTICVKTSAGTINFTIFTYSISPYQLDQNNVSEYSNFRDFELGLCKVLKESRGLERLRPQPLVLLSRRGEGVFPGKL